MKARTYSEQLTRFVDLPGLAPELVHQAIAEETNDLNNRNAWRAIIERLAAAAFKSAGNAELVWAKRKELNAAKRGGRS